MGAARSGTSLEHVGAPVSRALVAAQLIRKGIVEGGPVEETMPPAAGTARERRSFSRSTELDRRLRQVIPGGAHTYAKGADQYPDGMAPVIVRGQGAHVWDADGNRFVEFGSGLRSVALGHAHPTVTAAVRDAVRHGTNFTRPAAVELTAAEALLSLLPRADM